MSDMIASSSGSIKFKENDESQSETKFGKQQEG